MSSGNFSRREFFAENWSVEVANGAESALWTFTVPAKCVLQFESFGNYLGTVAAWGTAYFYLTQNGVPVEFYGGTPFIYDQVGYAAQRQKIENKIFGGGTRLVFMGNNPTAAALDMGVGLGYYLIYQE